MSSGLAPDTVALTRTSPSYAEQTMWSIFSSRTVGGRKQRAFLWPSIVGPARNTFMAPRNSCWKAAMERTVRRLSIRDSTISTVKASFAYEVETVALSELR
ncbi:MULTISPECIES: hypothetical protein [unclassified Streptomyces]|uniref:hypothetical protein n=1 Tax=unclassified Streptomyces TaxID=2593676 RepID=UPI003D9442E0